MIDILLASYNGEKYIAEQIDSILNQTYKDWFLYIKDDCSTDNTVKIIMDYEKEYKDKIKVILSDKPSGSAKNNFFSMFEYSNSDYIMTCDQDDVWLPDKIEITLEGMKEAEQENNSIPILVHTDLKVVDENLNVFSDSLFKMQNLDNERYKLNYLLTQNIVTGCTVMANKALLNHTKINPNDAIMHDWWMALIAASLGKIVFIDKATVMYRQHERNSVGAKNVRSIDYIKVKISNIDNIKKSIKDTYVQADKLLEAIGAFINSNNYDTIQQYSLMKNNRKTKKVYIMVKYKYWKKGLIRNLGQVILV